MCIQFDLHYRPVYHRSDQGRQSVEKSEQFKGKISSLPLRDFARSRVPAHRPGLMNFLVGVQLFLSVAVTACSNTNQILSGAINDEEKIYFTVLRKIIRETAKVDADRFFVNAFTLQNPKDAKRISTQLKALEPTTLEDFITQNQKTTRLEKLCREINCSIKEFDEINKLINWDGKGFDVWNSIYPKFDNRDMIISLSRVGYNQNKSQALVYFYEITKVMGHVWFTSSYLLYAKENGEWILKEEAGGTSGHIGFY